MIRPVKPALRKVDAPRATLNARAEQLVAESRAIAKAADTLRRRGEDEVRKGGRS